MPCVESMVITTKFIGMKATRNMSTHNVGIRLGTSNIVHIRDAIDEKPTMQKPLDTRLPAKAARMYHLYS